MVDGSDVKLIGIVFAPLLALLTWFIHHISGANRHPKAADVVYTDVCREREKANRQAHEQLKESIDAAIVKSDECPKAEDVVSNDVCDERGKANEKAHKYLKEGIEAAIARSDEQHNELQADIRSGFTEILGKLK